MNKTKGQALPQDTPEHPWPSRFVVRCSCSRISLKTLRRRKVLVSCICGCECPDLHVEFGSMIAACESSSCHLLGRLDLS